MITPRLLPILCASLAVAALATLACDGAAVVG